MSVFPRFLARWRVWLFVVFALLVVGAALLVPHITVNTDMTKYLPDDYPMKTAMDIVRDQMPGIEDKIQELGSSFGNGDDLMPTNLTRTIAIGVVLVFLVLLIMCTSFMEVLLFLVAAMFAVALNMGTNALLPSVSMMTNNISPVLQLVLSMDYSIILMNRYRQERNSGRLPVEAMTLAIDGSTRAILSSAFTTIVSLLMLTFIKLKIGADLGYVLAKGVVLSLLCTFTVLPALIVWADKSVIFKTKKIPRFPSEAMSRFQRRYRWPLTLLFSAIVVAAAVLQGRTPIYFAPDWDSKAAETETKDNPFLLLYSTEDEASMAELMHLMQADTNVLMAVSYPTTLGRQCSAQDMTSMMSEFGAQNLPEEFLQMVYYAMAHPSGVGRLSFAEIEAAADKLAASGMMPEGMSYDKMVAQVMAQLTPEEPEEPVAAEVLQTGTGPAEEAAALPAADSTVLADAIQIYSTAVKAAIDTTSAPLALDTTAVTRPLITPPEGIPALTYEDLTAQRTAAQMAALIGADARQMSLAYRMAGRAGKTMSMAELYEYARDNILGNKRYEAMIPKDMKQKLVAAGEYAEAILAAGEQAEAEALAEADVLPAADSLPTPQVADTLIWAAAPADSTFIAAVPAPAEPVVEVPEPEPTPLDRLVDMMVSGRRYTAAQVHSALSAAGVQVSRDDIDLLYLYTLSGRDYDPVQTFTPERLIEYVADTLLAQPSLQRIVPDETRQMVDSVRSVISENAGLLRGERYSFALLNTSYPRESPETFDFVDKVRAAADNLLPGPHYWIGESEMYKELKDAFPSELMLLTILTIVAIFVIVALTFRSVLIPVPLLLSVLTGVYVNVAVSGFGGGSMYYLAYLIIQGILMGAAIDYSILFTSYYRTSRKSLGLGDAIRAAYDGSSHSVLTSGLILSLVPVAMSFTMGDPVISAILRSLSVGAFAAVLIIMLLMPAVLAVLDPLTGSGHKEQNNNNS